MEKCDVFISYSRADLHQVEPFVKMIEQRANVKCWIDWTGIKSGSQFEEFIVKAIDSVEVVLFFISENSINSYYAKKEINYAYNVKKNVVPVILDGGNLRGWFLFKFGDVSFIDVRSQRQCDVLIEHLQEWCGTSAPVSTPSPTPTPAPASAPAPAPAKTYQVGDYYNDGVREGVVFEVSAGGRHGKIVSMKQSVTTLKWSSDSADYKRLIGANSEADGAANMAKVAAVSGWQDKYPAFKWCADLGDGWYLPSKEELLIIYKSRDKLNAHLTDVLSDDCWSSTEYFTFCVWNVRMRNGNTSLYSKGNFYYVRAVATF